MKNLLRKIAPIALFLSLLFTGATMAFAQVTNYDNSDYYASSTWKLVIDGEVSTSLNLSLSEIAAMPRIQVVAPLYCEGVLIADGEWVGIQIGPLLEKAGIFPSATNLEFHASDGYAINVAVAAGQNMVIAYELNGKPIDESLRLVLPEYMGMYWISMITEIDVTNSTNYTIGPPDPSIGIVVTPQPTQTPIPSASPQPTQKSTPTPTQQPTSSPSLAPKTTSTPIPTQKLNSTQPTETPTPNPTTPPTIAPTQSPTPPVTITQTPTQSPQTENQTTSTPNASQIGNQQRSTEFSISPSAINYGYAILLAVCVVAIMTGLLVLKDRTKR